MENQIEYLENFMTRVVAPAYQQGIDGQQAYGNFWNLPINILVLAAPKYPLFEKIEKTMQEGRVVRQRDASVGLYPAEWQRTPELRQGLTLLGKMSLDYYFLEPFKGKQKIIENVDKPYDAHTEKDRPRLRMCYFPANPPDAKERELAGFSLIYELPIMRRKVMLPKHQVFFQEADKETVYEHYRSLEQPIIFDFFKFAQLPDYPEVKFLDKLTEFLEYDIDFLESDGSRAEWWDTFLRNLRMGKFVTVHRAENLGSRKIYRKDPYSFIDFSARQDFEDRKKSL